LVYSNNNGYDDINNNNNSTEEDENAVYSTATIWLSGGNRPTLYIPHELAKRHNLDKPCRVAFYDRKKEGILIRFLHRQKKKQKQQ
jgi:hypothetical protein